MSEPGVKLAPAGITIRELIAEHCGGMRDGHTFYAYLPGRASGGILPAAMAICRSTSTRCSPTAVSSARRR